MDKAMKILGYQGVTEPLLLKYWLHLCYTIKTDTKNQKRKENYSPLVFLKSMHQLVHIF